MQSQKVAQSNDDELQQHDSYVPEADLAIDKSMNEDVDQPANVSVPLKQSFRNTQPPKHLIEEMEGHLTYLIIIPMY